MSKIMGKIFILYGPSGSGKSTLMTHSVNRMQNALQQVITYTTRPARSNELHGKDYFFISMEEFVKKNEEVFFLHVTKYLDNYYGASKEIIDDLISGKNLIAIFDRVGAQEVKSTIPDSILIWITAPIKELEKRLADRYSSNIAEYEKRIALVPKDIHIEESEKIADYSLVNTDIEAALKELEDIIKKETQRIW